MSSIRRALILGHSGFIGAHLDRALRDDGLEVTGVSLPDVDLTGEQSTRTIVDALTPETALVVLAGIKPAVANDATSFRANVAIALNVARAIEQARPVRVIFFSSAAVYGEDRHDIAITEATPSQPTSYYGIAKYASERLIARAVDPGTLVILRPATVYGPGDPSRQYGPSGFVHAALTGATVTLWGDGSELREFVYVMDLVRVAVGLVRSERSGTLNLVTGRSRSFAEVLDAVAAAAGRPPTVTRERTRPKVDHGFMSSVAAWISGHTFTSLGEGVALTIRAERDREAAAP